jgi:REP element-mobilizing transposase RayT
MMTNLITEYPQFFTATNLEWKKLLKVDKYKDIVISSMRFLVKNKRVRIFSFVIMENHIHLIWQMLPSYIPVAVQRDFLKYTAQRIQKNLQRNHPEVLAHFKVKAKDREYQFWERNALSVELRKHAVFLQKLQYIHENPVRAGICKLPEEYKYSSALFYETGIDNWGFLTHYND